MPVAHQRVYIGIRLLPVGDFTFDLSTEIMGMRLMSIGTMIFG